MKKTLFILFFLSFITISNGQIKTLEQSTKISEDAEMMGQFLLKKDYNSYLKYIYPKLINMLGGKEKFTEKLLKEFKKMNDEGFDFLSFTFGHPSEILSINNELQCTLTQYIEMKVQGGRLVNQSTLIAISNNGGKDWCFLDTSGKDIQTMIRMFPNLSEKLIIPKQDKPTFYGN